MLKSLSEVKKTNGTNLAILESYCRVRSAYHKQVRLAKKEFEISKTTDIVESTYSEGLNRLFKAFKKTNGTEVIDGIKFRDYCHELY